METSSGGTASVVAAAPITSAAMHIMVELGVLPALHDPKRKEIKFVKMHVIDQHWPMVSQPLCGC